jgi:hypothetical protein
MLHIFRDEINSLIKNFAKRIIPAKQGLGHKHDERWQDRNINDDTFKYIAPHSMANVVYAYT